MSSDDPLMDKAAKMLRDRENKLKDRVEHPKHVSINISHI